MKLYFSELQIYIDNLLAENNISDERKNILNPLIAYLAKKQIEKEDCNLIFICTHNSRRSHLAHIWATVAANWYDYSNINCFSGGTEQTAFNSRAVASLIRAGFHIENMDSSNNNNPRYKISFSESGNEIITFSKVYDHFVNPKENFAAVMVCSHADENCPYIPGAEKRFSIPYDDPKDFDGTSLESIKYDERCLEIAREMFFVFQQVQTLSRNK